MERYDLLTNEWAAQPSMNVELERDCVGVAIVNVSYGAGGRSDSPVLHSNV